MIILEPAIDGEVQQFFNIFDDETEVLKRTREAIERSEFELERQETFCSEWIFEDKEEVYNYNFGHQTSELEEGCLEKIKEQLGAKITHQPIHLKDKLVIFALQKRHRYEKYPDG